MVVSFDVLVYSSRTNIFHNINFNHTYNKPQPEIPNDVDSISDDFLTHTYLLLSKYSQIVSTFWEISKKPDKCYCHQSHYQRRWGDAKKCGGDIWQTWSLDNCQTISLLSVAGKARRVLVSRQKHRAQRRSELDGSENVPIQFIQSDDDRQAEPPINPRGSNKHWFPYYFPLTNWHSAVKSYHPRRRRKIRTI